MITLTQDQLDEVIAAVGFAAAAKRTDRFRTGDPQVEYHAAKAERNWTQLLADLEQLRGEDQ